MMAQGGDLARFNENVLFCIQAAGRINHSAVCYLNFHVTLIPVRRSVAPRKRCSVAGPLQRVRCLVPLRLRFRAAPSPKEKGEKLPCSTQLPASMDITAIRT